MNRKNIKKNIDRLVVLKQRQQNTVREEIFKIKEERKAKVKEIDVIEKQMESKEEEHSLRKVMFYRDTLANVFSNKDVYSFQIDLDRLDKEGADLYKQKDALIKELWEIDERLKHKQDELRNLMVRKEKYSYMLSTMT